MLIHQHQTTTNPDVDSESDDSAYLPPAMFIGVILAVVVGGAAAPDPVVQTVYGPVTGATDGGINVFHAVPFAEAPVR
jgi:hypothetical protein